MVWEMSFEEFQDALPRAGMNLAVLNLHVSPMPPTKFQLKLTIPVQMSFRDFQAGHLGYWNETNLAILNLHVIPMLPTMVGLNPTYRSKADMVWIFSRRPPWGISWISERNDFSNAESQCCSDTSDHVSAQSNLHIGRRCCSKIFEMADMAAILHIGTEWF